METWGTKTREKSKLISRLQVRQGVLQFVSVQGVQQGNVSTRSTVEFKSVQGVQQSTCRYSTLEYMSVQYSISTCRYSTVLVHVGTVQYSSCQYITVQFMSIQGVKLSSFQNRVYSMVHVSTRYTVEFISKPGVQYSSCQYKVFSRVHFRKLQQS